MPVCALEGGQRNPSGLKLARAVNLLTRRINYSETVSACAEVGAMQEGIISVDRPRIGVLVDDPSLISWLPGILGGAFHLVMDEPDGLMASVVLYLLDRQALTSADCLVAGQSSRAASRLHSGSFAE